MKFFLFQYDCVCLCVHTGQQYTFRLWWSEKASLAVEGTSASVTSEQSSRGGFGGALGRPFRGQKSKRGCNVFKLCRHKVIDVHTGRTGRVLFALAEDIMGSADILSKASSTSTPARSSHDVGSLSGLSVIWFTTAETRDDIQSVD